MGAVLQPSFHEPAKDYPLTDKISHAALGDDSVKGVFRLLAYLIVFIVLFGTLFSMLMR
jgi:hypothetical protein